jgi:hypothetical protein
MENLDLKGRQSNDSMMLFHDFLRRFGYFKAGQSMHVELESVILLPFLIKIYRVV